MSGKCGELVTIKVLPDRTELVTRSQAVELLAAEREGKRFWQNEYTQKSKLLLQIEADNAELTARVKAETELREDHQQRNKELEAKLAAVSAALSALDNTLATIGGCGDGNCIVLKPKGQHTNGGCRCSQDRMKMQRFASAMNQFRDVVACVCEASK